MKKIVMLSLTLGFLAACRQDMDACECGKKLLKPTSKEAMDCDDYWRMLDEEEGKAWQEKALKCYTNEKFGSDIQ
ncbi:MAG: hypothetical protein EB023_09385 [Flavobacteriia bacterium]|jgi:hypothetical protein|nr:hypothetical protein [Flavobacteriia bacterium]